MSTIFNISDKIKLTNIPEPDLDYTALKSYATTQGYSLPSNSQQIIQEQLIKDLKTAGVWDKLDLLYVFATDGDNDFATLNWKAPSSFQTTKVNSPTFTADSGFTGDGLSSYLDTNFTISTDATNYSQNNASTFVYINNDLSQSDSAPYGIRVDANSIRNQLRVRNADYRPAINDIRPIISADYRSNNWHHQKRTASTGFTTYLDSTSFTNTIASLNPSGLNDSMHLLSINLVSQTLFYSSGTIKVFGLGEALDNTDLKDAIDTYLSAL